MFSAIGKVKLPGAHCTNFLSLLIEGHEPGVLAIWKPHDKRGVGIKKATKLVETAQKSIGIQTGLRFSRQELQYLLDR